MPQLQGRLSPGIGNAASRFRGQVCVDLPSWEARSTVRKSLVRRQASPKESRQAVFWSTLERYHFPHAAFSQRSIRLAHHDTGKTWKLTRVEFPQFRCVSALHRRKLLQNVRSYCSKEPGEPLLMSTPLTADTHACLTYCSCS